MISHFLDFWLLGLQPSLSVDTSPNGIVTASVSASGFPTSPLPLCSTDYYSPTPRRRSGNGARRKRKFKRANIPVDSKASLEDGLIATEKVDEEANGPVNTAENADLDVMLDNINKNSSFISLKSSKS